MAFSAPRVLELSPGLGNKTPIVALLTKRQLECAESVGVSDLAVGDGRAGLSMAVLAAGTDDKFADTARRVRMAVGILGREALVVVVAGWRRAKCSFLPPRVRRVTSGKAKSARHHPGSRNTNSSIGPCLRTSGAIVQKRS